VIYISLTYGKVAEGGGGGGEEEEEKEGKISKQISNTVLRQTWHSYLSN